MRLRRAIGAGMEAGQGEIHLYPGQEQKEVFNVALDPAFPDAWTKPPFLAAIKS